MPGLRTCPIPGVAAVAALNGLLLIADMVLHLALQTGLEDLLHEIGGQTTRADQVAPIGPRLINELLR